MDTTKTAASESTASTPRRRYVLIGLVLLVVAGTVGYRLFDHVALRVDAWWNPWPDASDRAFQIVQSLLDFRMNLVVSSFHFVIVSTANASLTSSSEASRPAFFMRARQYWQEQSTTLTMSRNRPSTGSRSKTSAIWSLRN